MPDNPADRIQFILGVILFSALALGLVLTALLRFLRWRYERRTAARLLATEAALYGDTPPETPVDPYAIAEEALHLVEQVQAENVRLKQQLARQNDTGSAAPTREPLPLAFWLEYVNRRPDRVPHLFLEGGSGAGKTTLALAILASRLSLDPAPVAVIGVKPDDGWGESFIYRSAERPAALAALLADVRRRLDNNNKSGLTIVLDDFTRLASQHKEAVELYKEVADVGRSLRVRLILIARGRLVKGIGASGESDLLEHFVFLSVDRNHRVTLETEDEILPLDTAEVHALSRPIPPHRWWKPAPVPTEDESILSRLLAQVSVDGVPASGSSKGGQQATNILPVAPGTAGIPHSDAGTPDTGETEDTATEREGIPAYLTAEAVQTLYAVWGSKSKIAAMLTGKKQKRLAQVDTALHGTNTESEAKETREEAATAA